MSPPDAMLYANGIDGSSGKYLLDPLTPAEVFELARAASLPPGDPHLLELQLRNDAVTRPDEALATGDPRRLEQAGWGVLFARDADPAVCEALGPLLKLRRSQAGKDQPHYYREYRGDDGVGTDETKQQFLSRHGVALGMPADPEYMPYYLLLVGGPEQVSYRFQYELDVEYAVGRIGFDTVEEYARYAAGVVEAETGPVERGRRALLFAAHSPGDVATGLSSNHLVPPLAGQLTRPRRDAQGNVVPGWDVQTVLGPDATKARLAGLLAAETPTVLFTASHGLYFPPADPRHRPHAGALLCSDWPGPGSPGPVREDCYFTADDLPAEAQLQGCVAVHFACFGAGVPAEEDFPHERRLNRGRPLAERPFVSALPRRLLAHPRGGALAVVGHVEQAWAYSFLGDHDQPQVQVFRAFFEQLLDGCPVGLAMEWFNQRYAALATALTGALGPLLLRRQLDEKDLLQTASLWTGHNDARSYVVLGDPAVRLRLTPGPAQLQLAAAGHPDPPM
jgi:hypothetical protein